MKDRQAELSTGPRSTAQKQGPRPFWEQQRPRYLLSGKMICGVCGSAFAKGGKHRFRCQGSAKKGEVFCGNRLSIRQDEIDQRVLGGLQNELMQPDVLAAFQAEYAAELARLSTQSDCLRPEHEREYATVSDKLTNLKAAILKGLDPTIFVEEMNQLQGRQRALEAELAIGEEPPAPNDIVLRADLADLYRAKIAGLTEAFEDEALRTEAFDRIRPLIDSVTLTPEREKLAIALRGEHIHPVRAAATSGVFHEL